MVSKRKIAMTAATFGAAMTSMYTAPELQADIVDITWNGGNATTTNPHLSFSTLFPPGFDIDQVPGTIDFYQWNDTYGGTGRTVNVGAGWGMLSATVVALGQSLDPATFSGVGNSVSVGIFGGTEFDGSGTNYIGFRSFANQGNVGWFKLEYTVDGPIIYSEGEYGDAGETVVVGGTGGGGTFPPDSFTAFRGIFVSGDLNSLLASDNVDLCYNPGITLFPTEAPVTLDFVGTSPDDTPASISVTIESSANTVGLGLTFRMWKFTGTPGWQTVGTFGQTNNVDTVRTASGVPADHVQAGTGEVRTRYEVRRVSFIFLFPWTDCVDQVFWTAG
jgi:hypothetical protein